MKTTTTKRFTRTCKMSGIGYYIIDNTDYSMSNEHFSTISETNKVIELLEKNQDNGYDFNQMICIICDVYLEKNNY